MSEPKRVIFSCRHAPSSDPRRVGRGVCIKCGRMVYEPGTLRLKHGDGR